MREARLSWPASTHHLKRCLRRARWPRCSGQFGDEGGPQPTGCSRGPWQEGLPHRCLVASFSPRAGICLGLGAQGRPLVKPAQQVLGRAPCLILHTPLHLRSPTSTRGCAGLQDQAWGQFGEGGAGCGPWGEEGVPGAEVASE